MEYSLVPSLPASSFDELAHLAENMKGVSKGLQVDVVDGQFAPHTSWPFTEEDVSFEWQKLSELTKDFEIEVDCMVHKPGQYLEMFAKLSIPRVIIHVGSTERYGDIILHAKEVGYTLGFAFTNDVPISFLYPYLEKVDFVQIMGIKEVGQQGQSFDERTLKNIIKLRSEYPDLEIAVDGSVNAETIPRLLEAGANRFAPGSAISKSENQADAYKQLHTLLP